MTIGKDIHYHIKSKLKIENHSRSMPGGPIVFLVSWLFNTSLRTFLDTLKTNIVPMYCLPAYFPPIWCITTQSWCKTNTGGKRERAREMMILWVVIRDQDIQNSGLSSSELAIRSFSSHKKRGSYEAQEINPQQRKPLSNIEDQLMKVYKIFK